MSAADEIEDDLGFPNDDIKKCIEDSVDAVIGTASWDETKVPHWINEINEKTMKALYELK